MAESQGQFSYTAETSGELIEALSRHRFAPYLKRAGFKEDLAFQLYLYNARLAKAFLFPLHVVEIVLRNAIDEILCASYSITWPRDANFLAILTPESRASLDKAVTRSTTGSGWSKDDVIANLTFDFWSNLFRPEYDRSLWQTNMRLLLPNDMGMNRASFQPLVAGVNHFRNRIAHHEPILKENAAQKLKDITNVVGYRSAASADWLKKHSTVFQTMKTAPSGSGTTGPKLGDRCDTAFDLVEESEPLSKCNIKNTCAIVCQIGGKVTAVIDSSDIGRFLLDKRDDTGLVDLGEHTVGNVVEWADARKSFTSLDAGISLGGLEDQLKKKTIRFALVSDSTSTLVGVIRKAHRKY